MARDVFTLATGTAAASGDSFGVSLDAAGGADTLTIDDTALVAGDKISLSFGDTEVSYTVTAEDVASTDTAAVVAVGLKAAIEQNTTDIAVDYDPGTATDAIEITNNQATSVSVAGQVTNAGAGGLGALAAIDVSTSGGATAASVRFQS